MGLKFIVDPLKVDPVTGEDYDFSPGGKDEPRIDDTFIYSSMINRYFTPQGYNEWGYMFYIAVTEEVFSCKSKF